MENILWQAGLAKREVREEHLEEFKDEEFNMPAKLHEQERVTIEEDNQRRNSMRLDVSLAEKYVEIKLRKLLTAMSKPQKKLEEEEAEEKNLNESQQQNLTPKHKCLEKVEAFVDNEFLLISKKKKLEEEEAEEENLNESQQQNLTPKRKCLEKVEAFVDNEFLLISKKKKLVKEFCSEQHDKHADKELQLREKCGPVECGSVEPYRRTILMK